MAIPSDLARSVEVHVVNQTRFRLTVESCRVTGKWIDGETPAQGNAIDMFQDAVWGAYTSNAADAVDGSVTLVGLGDGPVTLTMQMDVNGGPSCKFVANNALGGAVDHQMTSEEGNFAQYQLVLTQIVAA